MWISGTYQATNHLLVISCNKLLVTTDGRTESDDPCPEILGPNRIVTWILNFELPIMKSLKIESQLQETLGQSLCSLIWD